MSNPPAKRLRVDNNDSNGIRNAVAGIVQGMVAAVERRIAIFDTAGGRRDGEIHQNERSEAHVAEVDTSKTSNVAGTSEEHTSLAPKVISMGGKSTATLTTESGQEQLFEQGYDSNGYLPNFGEIEEEDHFEPAVQSGITHDNPTVNLDSVELATEGAAFVLITEEDMNKMKVDELKAELKKRGLAVRGKKDELKEKLKKAMEDKVPVLATATSEPTRANQGFAEGTFWQFLHPEDEAVPDPTEGTDFFRPLIKRG